MNLKPVIDKLAGSFRAAEKELFELRAQEYPIGKSILVDDLYVRGDRSEAKVAFHPVGKVASLGISVRDDEQYIVNIERCHARG